MRNPLIIGQIIGLILFACSKPRNDALADFLNTDYWIWKFFNQISKMYKFW